MSQATSTATATNVCHASGQPTLDTPGDRMACPECGRRVTVSKKGNLPKHQPLKATAATEAEAEAAAEAPASGGRRRPRIPADADVWVCDTCGEELTVRKFPTTGDGRLTECRGCRDAKRAQRKG